MAKRNKAKEEVAKVSKPENVASNKEEKMKQEVLEEQQNSTSTEEVISTPEEQPEHEQPTEEPVKLHIIADDRLNSLIAKANELGITDVIQIISSDKYGQFYMVYRA